LGFPKRSANINDFDTNNACENLVSFGLDNLLQSVLV